MEQGLSSDGIRKAGYMQTGETSLLKIGSFVFFLNFFIFIPMIVVWGESFKKTQKNKI